MVNIRQPAVAGQFYPGSATSLNQMLSEFFDETVPTDVVPKAIIAPHAGYIYSGPIAASAYSHLMSTTVADSQATIRRVVLLGPAHRVSVKGIAASSADIFATPLGEIPVDKEAIKTIIDLPQVQFRDDAHAFEHSLEVHLPFLQRVCREFSIVPLAVGRATIDEVTEVLERLWGGPETLIVISSDLSHYHDYETARAMDSATSKAIEDLLPNAISQEGACGRVSIQGVLEVARKRGLKAVTVDLRNSGDTAGPRNQVVGYGAYIIA
jgi:AmmeMemoRadiSam system protein B